jgi:hypothetical protein
LPDLNYRLRQLEKRVTAASNPVTEGSNNGSE